MSYHIKCWRNTDEKFEPTINEYVDEPKLVEYLNIMIANIQAEISDPLIHRVEIKLISQKRRKKIE